MQHRRRENHLLAGIEDHQVGIVAEVDGAFVAQLEESCSIAAGQTGKALEAESTAVDAFAEQKRQERLSAGDTRIDHVEPRRTQLHQAIERTVVGAGVRDIAILDSTPDRVRIRRLLHRRREGVEAAVWTVELRLGKQQVLRARFDPVRCTVGARVYRGRQTTCRRQVDDGRVAAGFACQGGRAGHCDLFGVVRTL